MNAITIRDVARAAHVSVGTVSMVLNDSGGVSEATRHRVQMVIGQLGYRRNMHARSLSLNRSLNIGCVVTDLSNPFFGEMVAQLQTEIHARDNELVLGMSQNRIAQERCVLDRMVQTGVDGLIVAPAHERAGDTSHIRSLIERRIPVVFISSYYAGFERGSVMTDLSKGAYLLTQHLLQAGRQRIAFVGGYRGLALTELRIQGYRLAHEHAMMQPDESLIVEADPVFAGGYEAALRVVEAKERPDAVVAINDLTCMGVLCCLRERGIRVPEDIALTGYDDLVFAAMLETPLTTIRQPIAEMCTVAVDMLFRLIAGEEPPEGALLLDPELIVRTSG